MATPLATAPTKRPLEVRAVLRHGRFSAYKAREVLNLIRGKTIEEARSILLFTERGCAVPILKVLDSAVANAGANNDMPPEELFITACFADEGATLRRFRPRARGRGTRVRKRTCHVTIVVARLSAAELERKRTRDAGRRAAPADARAARARRVAKSRKSGEAEAAVVAEESSEPTPEQEATIEEVVTDRFAEDALDAADETATDEAATDETAADETATDEAEAGDAAAEDPETNEKDA